MKKKSELISEYIRRAMDVVGFSENYSAKYSSMSKDVHAKLISVVEKELKGTFKNSSSVQKQIKNELEKHYDLIYGEVFSTAATLAASESKWITGFLNGATETDIKVKSANRALRKTFQGHTFNWWFKSLGITDVKRTTDILKLGYANGKTTAEIVSELKVGFTRSEHDLKTLARSYLNSASQEAREDVYQSTDSVIGYVWTSVLDARTTPHICGLRDSKKYDKNYKPIGHTIQWEAGPGRIHFNCRSNSLPILKGLPDLWDDFTRPSIGAGKNYELGDNTNSRGKVRKPNKDTVDKGIYKIQNVSAKTDYENFLRRQKIDYINDILKNKQDAIDFKNGKTLFDISISKNITVNEL